MSILGFVNHLRTLEMKSAWRGENKRSLLGEATFIERHGRMSRKYPRDPWLRTSVSACSSAT